VPAAVDGEHALIVAQQVTVPAGDNGSLQARAAAAQAAAGEPTQAIHVVADAGYWNGAQAAACEAQGILPQVPANRGVNSRGDGTLLERTEFTYQPESDTFLCPAGQTLARKQRMRKDRAVLYAAQPEVCRACPLKSPCTVWSRRTVTRHLHEEALQRRQPRATPEAMQLRGATASIRQLEIPHLRTSTLPASWTARSANGNQLGRSRLQSETHAKHSRRTPAACSPAGQLIPLPPTLR